MACIYVARATTAQGQSHLSRGFAAQFSTGDVAPRGCLTFVDHASNKRVKSTVIDSFTVTRNKATFTGKATVNGVSGFTFFVEVEDLGEPRSVDAFRIVLGDGYGATGVLLRGNIQVQGGLAVP